MLGGDPVRDVVDAWPTAATITTVDKAAKDYDPKVVDTGAGGQSTPLVGFYSSKTEAGDDFSATFLIKPDARPSHLKSKISRIRIGEETFTVSKIRIRRWEGRINGYTLELTL